MCMLLYSEPIHSPNVPFEYFGARADEGDTPLERRQQMSPDLMEYDGGRKPSRTLLDSGVCTTVPFCRVSINPPKKTQDEDHVDYAGVRVCRVEYTGIYWSILGYTGVYWRGTRAKFNCNLGSGRKKLQLNLTLLLLS